MLSVLTIAPHKLTPERLDAIQAFRASVYGDIPACVGGRNVERADEHSWHVLLVSDGEILGSARYFRKGLGVVELGGFCVRRKGTRDAARVVQGVRELAARLGDTRFIAHASTDTGSSSILRKLGGVVVGSYFNEAYQNNAHVIVISMV